MYIGFEIIFAGSIEAITSVGSSKYGHSIGIKSRTIYAVFDHVCIFCHIDQYPSQLTERILVIFPINQPWKA